MATLLAPSPKVLEVVKTMIVGPGAEFANQMQFDHAMDVAKGIMNAPMNKTVITDAAVTQKLGMIAKGMGMMGVGAPNPMQAFAGALNELQAGMKAGGVQMAKEINFADFADAVPSYLALNVFDLSGPARITAPYMAPLRSKIPRVDGMGPAALSEIITGFSGSATGGVGSVSPFFPLNVPMTGGNTEGARGNPVEYALGNVIVPYKFSALYDAVTMPAEFSAYGFQDLRGMSSALLMQMAMMAEERAILMGRSNVLATVGAATGTARAAANGEVGIIGAGSGGTNVYVKVTAIGPFGQTGAGVVSSAVNIADTVTRVIDYTWTDVTGALGYNVFVAYQDAGATAPVDFFQDYVIGGGQSTGWNQFTVGAFGRRTTGLVPGSDTGTGSADSYRGIIQTIEEGPISGTDIRGTVGRLNDGQGTNANVLWLQNIFATQWQNAKADPEEVLMNALTIADMSKIILSGTQASNYRITESPDGAARGITAGIAVTAVLNETTQKTVKLTVHPWLPFGNAVILSYGLPFPTAFGQTTTMEMKGPQDYMQISWPLTTLRWEQTILWMNSLVIYAPTFFAIEHGIAHQDDAAAGPLC